MLTPLQLLSVELDWRVSHSAAHSQGLNELRGARRREVEIKSIKKLPSKRGRAQRQFLYGPARRRAASGLSDRCHVPGEVAAGLAVWTQIELFSGCAGTLSAAVSRVHGLSARRSGPGVTHLVSLVAVCCRDSSRSLSVCIGRMFFSSSSLLDGRLLSLRASESFRKTFMASSIIIVFFLIILFLLLIFLFIFILLLYVLLLFLLLLLFFFLFFVLVHPQQALVLHLPREVLLVVVTLDHRRGNGVHHGAAGWWERAKASSLEVPHLSNLCMVRARVLLSSSMMRLGGCRGTGSVPYASECPPMGVWPGGAGHFWKVTAEGSMLPAGTEIRSFFGGRGGDSFTDMQGSFTGAPSAGEGGEGDSEGRGGVGAHVWPRERRTCDVVGQPAERFGRQSGRLLV
ncbi:unnamed protein product [Menidia menidia]|uniref:(Atlantic silverside) hypothetical protein n=1 Tax=Menidia menidia TaxID=238744 RepID=A0A8S4A8P2_9TELE|nr:unnamed protein product [Menidia menidia]